MAVARRGRGVRFPRPIFCATLVLLAVAGPVHALETDQYFAWTRPLRDSTDAVNAKFNLEIARALQDLARKRGGAPSSCGEAAARIHHRLTFIIFQPIELWVLQSPLIDRAPARGAEDVLYPQKNLYRRHGLLDFPVLMPISPTIDVDGVRIGTDKLSHFVSSGWRYRDKYLAARARGLSDAQAEHAALRKGVFEENTLLGKAASGVFSVSDMEANFGGMHFYLELCEGPNPLLVLENGAWRPGRPFDIRRYVTPEWDESYQTPIYAKGRWRKVLPVLKNYCEFLTAPLVQERLKRYAERARVTPTEEAVAELVKEGKLPDPERFSLYSNCPGAGPPPAPTTEALAAEFPPAAPRDTKLMDAIAAHDENRELRTYALIAAGVSYPKRVSGSAGLLRAKTPRDYDCRAVCDVRGFFAQAEPGVSGGQISVGGARVIGEAEGHERLLTKVYLAYAFKAAVLRTWGSSPLHPQDQTLAGGEAELTAARVNLRLGVFRRIGGGDGGREWIVTGGVGWGF